MSRVHERYRQTDDRQPDGRQQIANVNVIKKQPFGSGRVSKPRRSVIVRGVVLPEL